MENKALNDIKICGVEMLVERPSPQKRPLFAAFFVEMGGQGSAPFQPYLPALSSGKGAGRFAPVTYMWSPPF